MTVDTNRAEQTLKVNASQSPSITTIGRVADLTAGHLTDRKDGEFSNQGYLPAKIR